MRIFFDLLRFLFIESCKHRAYLTQSRLKYIIQEVPLDRDSCISSPKS